MTTNGDDAVAMIIEHFLQMSRWAGYLSPPHTRQLAAGLHALAHELESYHDDYRRH